MAELYAFHDGPDVIPVLAPSDEVRQHRWAQVLAELEQVGSVRTAASGLRLVTFWPALEPVLRVAARSLGCDAGTLSGWDEFWSLVASPAVDSVLLCGPLEHLGTAALLDQLIAAGDSANLGAWSLFPVENVADLTYFAAKVALGGGPATRPASAVAVDGFGRRMVVDGRTVALTGQRLAMVKTKTDLLIVSAHGDGVHADLADGVLCGVVGARELINGHASEEGCCDDRCRRHGGARTERVRATDLAAPLLALLTCNGYAVTANPYPSNSSLVRAAFDGPATTILTTLGTVTIDSSDPIVVDRLLGQGFTAHEVAATLNDIRAWRSERARFVVCGMPVPAAADGPRAKDAAGLTLEPARLQVQLVSTISLAPPLELSIDGEVNPVNGAVVSGRRSSLVLSGLAGKATLRSADQQLDRLGECLSRVGSRLVELQDFVESLTIAPPVPDDDQARGAQDVLTQVTRTLDRNWRRLVRLTNDVFERGFWTSSVADGLGEIQACIAACDQALAQVFLSVPGTAPFRRLHYLRLGSHTAPGEPCRLCGTVTHTIEHAPAAPNRSIRVSVDCPVCGPVAEYRLGGPRLEMDLLPGAESSRRLTIQWRIDLGDALDYGRLAIQLLDKASDSVLLREQRLVRASADDHLLEFELPDSVPPDLHELRVTWISGLDCATACRRIAVVPAERR